MLATDRARAGQVAMGSCKFCPQQFGTGHGRRLKRRTAGEESTMAPYRSETSWPVERGSPTKLTNYYEDVEAPRVFREPSSRAPTVLAAEHFADRRRPRKQMGKFVPTSPSTISMASRQLRQQVAEQARRRRQQSSSSRSTGPSTDDVVRGCVRGTFSVGRHMTQCLITTAGKSALVFGERVSFLVTHHPPR